MYNPESVLENDTHKLLWDFEIKTGHLISARPYNKEKKRTWRIEDFTVPADHRVKLKEGEKKDIYLNLTWELKKLWNMKVKVVPIEICALGTVT